MVPPMSKKKGLSSSVTAVRQHEETRPKHAGVHQDQLKRVHTRSNRRKAKQRGYNHDDN